MKTITFDEAIYKLVPVEPILQSIVVADIGRCKYQAMLTFVPADLPGVVHQSDSDMFNAMLVNASEIDGALFTHPPAQPADQLYALLDKAASLLTESALSEDYDGDEALELVAAIRGEFVSVGKTTVENQLEVIWENIRIAAGFDKDDEFTLSKALAKIAAPAQPDTEALQAKPTDGEQLLNSMQFGSDMVSKYSAVCKELAAIKRVAECGSVTSFLSLSDDDKRKWFAIGIDESSRRKKTEQRVEELEAQIAAQAGQSPVTGPEVIEILEHLDRTLLGVIQPKSGDPLQSPYCVVWGSYVRRYKDLIRRLYAAPPAPANAIDIVQAGAEFNSGCNDIGACGCAAPCDVPHLTQYLIAEATRDDSDSIDSLKGLVEILAEHIENPHNIAAIAWGTKGLKLVTYARGVIAAVKRDDVAGDAAFSVSVAAMNESHRVTHWVQLFNNRTRPKGLNLLDETGYISPFMSEIKDHAVTEAKAWAEFLGVHFDAAIASAKDAP